MNRLLREAFVELHSRPLLQELHAELQVPMPPSISPLPPTPLPMLRCVVCLSATWSTFIRVFLILRHCS